MKQIIITLENPEVRAAEEFGDKESIAKVRNLLEHARTHY
jgi:hypothetical protein